jgi:hypothetical protein
LAKRFSPVSGDNIQTRIKTCHVDISYRFSRHLFWQNEILFLEPIVKPEFKIDLWTFLTDFPALYFGKTLFFCFWSQYSKNQNWAWIPMWTFFADFPALGKTLLFCF